MNLLFFFLKRIVEKKFPYGEKRKNKRKFSPLKAEYVAQLISGYTEEELGSFNLLLNHTASVKTKKVFFFLYKQDVIRDK